MGATEVCAQICKRYQTNELAVDSTEEVDFAEEARTWAGICVSEKLPRNGDYILALASCSSTSGPDPRRGFVGLGPSVDTTGSPGGPFRHGAVITSHCNRYSMGLSTKLFHDPHPHARPRLWLFSEESKQRGIPWRYRLHIVTLDPCGGTSQDNELSAKSARTALYEAVPL